MTIDPERAAHCASCGRAIPPEDLTYRLRVDLFADPTPPSIGDEDLVADNREEWDRLIAAMSAMSDSQAEEERDKVFERYEFTLCAECRRQYHEQLAGLKAG